MSADTFFTNGLIYTVDSSQPWTTAAAVKNGRFIAVGQESDIAHLIGPNTEVVDLEGRMAMPGMMDIHNHVLIGGGPSATSCAFRMAVRFHRLQTPCARLRRQRLPELGSLAVCGEPTRLRQELGI